VKVLLGVDYSGDQERKDFDFLASISVIENELESINNSLGKKPSW
tara:strand:- start:155 stop:289 length:135 start_codon:yes stop_codon:yes gene_type:complete